MHMFIVFISLHFVSSVEILRHSRRCCIRVQRIQPHTPYTRLATATIRMLERAEKKIERERERNKKFLRHGICISNPTPWGWIFGRCFWARGPSKGRSTSGPFSRLISVPGFTRLGSWSIDIKGYKFDTHPSQKYQVSHLLSILFYIFIFDRRDYHYCPHPFPPEVKPLWRPSTLYCFSFFLSYASAMLFLPEARIKSLIGFRNETKITTTWPTAWQRVNPH